MNSKNEVFEYLIDQLRQQLPVVDVMGEIKRWSIDRSIAGRGNYTDEENAIIDAYIGLEHNPYKQQCEDLAHEVQSLKNQLRDASAQIKELHLALVKATGDVEAYKLIRKGGYISEGQSYVVGEHGPEQSGCCKEDAPECGHNRYVFYKGAMYKKCGAAKSDECEHDWVEFHGLFIAEGDPRNEPGYTFCRKCGLKEYSRKCEHEWCYVMGDGPGVYECDVCGAQSKTLPYDLRWLA